MLRRVLRPLYLVHLTLTSRTGSRFRLEDDPVDDAIFRHLHGFGAALYFPSLSDAEPHGIILDVGAHHGMYAVEALRRYPHCTVIAIEPDPAACRKIADTARLNDLSSRIEIVCAGLADSDGPGWLALHRSGSWGSRTRSTKPAPDAQPVDLKTLDTILRGRQPVMVKCNAEGAEFALVKQLLSLGYRPRLIVLMVHPEAGSPDALVPLLADAGYRIIDADSPPRGYRFHCFLSDDTHTRPS